MKLHKHFYIAVVILAVSAMVSQVYFRWLVHAGVGKATPLAKPLASIPRKLGNWQGTDAKIEPNVLLKIGAEDTLLRAYDQGENQPLRVYIAYFGGIRGTAPHSPTVCRPGQGFHLIGSEVVTLRLPGFGDEPLQVHKDLFERNFQKELVVWWEYIHGRSVSSRLMQRLQWALPQSLGGKRGSVLQVQISLGFSDGMEASMSRVVDFMNRLGPHIQAVLPAAQRPEQAKVDNGTVEAQGAAPSLRSPALLSPVPHQR